MFLKIFGNKVGKWVEARRAWAAKACRELDFQKGVSIFGRVFAGDEFTY